MTGWRLGWLVVPETLTPVIERIAQNAFICASAVAQHAALACFEPESLVKYESRRAEFKAGRDYFIPELNRLGLRVPVMEVTCAPMRGAPKPPPGWVSAATGTLPSS